MSTKSTYTRGRGAQLNTGNKFSSTSYEPYGEDGETDESASRSTKLFFETPKKVVNKVESPDIPLGFSVNPYQGCEHGCAYCYARNTHHYWGFGAGVEFENNIVVKKNAPGLVEAQFNKRTWKAHPLMLSGNTDCYQPVERKFKITRRILEVCLKYRNPVGIITKNRLLLRDLDLLKALAGHGLVHVMLSINTTDEKLRQKLEPRTSTYKQRIQTLETLRENDIPAGVMVAPMIPSLNNHHMPQIMKDAAEVGALTAGYIVVRLNGDVAAVFEDWLDHHYPDRKQKVLNQISGMHGGQVSDSRFKTRMRGEGKFAENIGQMFRLCRKRYFQDREMPGFNRKAFIKGGQLNLDL